MTPYRTQDDRQGVDDTSPPVEPFATASEDDSGGALGTARVVLRFERGGQALLQVYPDGRILVDGRPATDREIADALRRIAAEWTAPAWPVTPHVL